jgi:ABC-type multidrug transport system fused ATPase/permease subunit
LNYYIRKIRFEIFMQVLFATLGTIAIGLMSYIPKIIFDSFTVNVSFKFIFIIILLYLFLSLISVFSSYFEMIFNWKYAVKFENLIKKDYFTSIMKYNDIDFHKRAVSDYISIQSNDIMQIEQDYLTPMVSAINQILRVIIFGAIMFFGIDYRIAMVIFISSLFAAFLPRYTGKITSPKRLDFVDKLSQYTETIYDFFTGFRQINSRTIKKITQRHQEKLDNTQKSRFNYGKSKSLSLSINSMARTVVQVLGFATAIILLYKGEISIGTAVATLGFITSFIDPLEESLYCFTTMETVKAVKNKVFAMINNNYSNNKLKESLNYDIILNNANLHNGTFKLEDISLIFQKNKHYAIIGPNGSGKSTLLNAILGYLYLESGEILFNNKDITEYDLSWNISHIQQKSHIFSSGYIDNVTMFESYCDLSDEIIHQIGLSQDLVKKIKEQLKSTSLSGGEQQIIAYIRARNSGNSILVMDEPFSAVDKDTKKLLMEDMSNLSDKTIIMVTHDVDESLDYFDEIIRLDNGHIINDMMA